MWLSLGEDSTISSQNPHLDPFVCSREQSLLWLEMESMTPQLLKKQILELLWALLALTQLKTQLIWSCWMITLLLLSREWRKVKITLLSPFSAESCWQPHSTAGASWPFPPGSPPSSFWLWKWDFDMWKKRELNPFRTRQSDNKWIIPPLSQTASVCCPCLFTIQTKVLPILILCSSEPHKDTSCFLYIFTLLLAHTSPSPCSTYDSNTYSTLLPP